MQTLQDYFLHTLTSVIEKTFEATTQFVCSGWITGHISDTYTPLFPALKYRHHNEPVATDTIYTGIPAVDNGSTCAQLYVGKTSKISNVFGIRNDGEFVDTLMGVIQKG